MENTTKEKGFKGVKNWIGKIILMIIGTVWLVSDVYDNVMSNFFLTERVVEKWGTSGDIKVLLATVSLVLGGVYLNTIFEVFKSIIPKK